MPAELIAWTLMLNDVPATTVDGAFRTCSETAGWGRAAVTPMPDSVPVSLDVGSVAEIDWVPGSTSTTVKVWVPASAAVNV